MFSYHYLLRLITGANKNHSKSKAKKLLTLLYPTVSLSQKSVHHFIYLFRLNLK